MLSSSLSCNCFIKYSSQGTTLICVGIVFRVVSSPPDPEIGPGTWRPLPTPPLSEETRAESIRLSGLTSRRHKTFLQHVSVILAVCWSYMVSNSALKKGQSDDGSCGSLFSADCISNLTSLTSTRAIELASSSFAPIEEICNGFRSFGSLSRTSRLVVQAILPLATGSRRSVCSPLFCTGSLGHHVAELFFYSAHLSAARLHVLFHRSECTQ